MTLQSKIDMVNDILKKEGVKFEAKFKKIYKNNVVLDAIEFVPLKMSPIMYIDEEEIVHGDPYDIASTIKDFVATYNYDANRIEKYFTEEHITSHVYPKVISVSNLSWVKDMNYVYDLFLDMIVLFYVEIPTGDSDQMASFTLTYEHLTNMGISEDDVYYHAKANLKHSWELKTMNEILGELMPGCDDYGFMPMYIATRPNRLQGAAVLWINSILDDISETVDDDMIIFPSSIHEIICVPRSMSSDIDDMEGIVVEANECLVTPQEKLTDSVYIYDGHLRKV